MVALRQHGDGVRHLEETTVAYIKELLDKMETESSPAFEPKGMIRTTIGKLLMTLIYGFGNEKGLKRFLEIEEQSKRMFSETGPGLLLDVCPPLRYFVPSIRNFYSQFLSLDHAFNELCNEFTDQRKREYDRNNPNIYIDHFFDLIGKPIKVGPGTTDTYAIDEKDVTAMGMNLLIAGQSTSRSMDVLLGLLVNHQDIQERAYREIQQAIGDRTPTCGDRAKLPYLEAIILESLRYGSTVTFGLPHCASEDTELNGYLIPKGTMVFYNAWSISHDPRYCHSLRL